MQVHVELSVCLMRWWEISISLKMSLISAWHYELKLMFLFCIIMFRIVWIWKWRPYFLVRGDRIFALATCPELVVACPRALACVMNFAWAQGKVTLLVLRVFLVEAFTISPLCHHLNYLAAFLIHTSAALVWSGHLTLQTSHLLRKDQLKQSCKKQLSERLDSHV